MAALPLVINFDIFSGKTHDDFVIHHLIEQQSKNYSNLVDDLFLHAPANLRAIPKGIVNEVVHLSKIRIMWNNLYIAVGGMSKKQIFAALKSYAAYTDNFLSDDVFHLEEGSPAYQGNLALTDSASSQILTGKDIS